MPNLTHGDLERVRLLLRAYELGCLDPDSPGPAYELDRAHDEFGHHHDLVGDDHLALEICHAHVVLESLQRDLPAVAVPTVSRSPWRVCAEPGCPDLVTLWWCTHHDLAHAEDRRTR